MKKVKVGCKDIYNFGEPFVIAEIGSNHNGNIELAKNMIRIAKENGADCVKFQSWSKDTIFSRKVYDDNYFLSDDYRNREDFTLEEIVDEFSLGRKEHLILKDYCEEIGIMFATTPFSRSEVDFIVDELEVSFIKIASMDLNNYPFLEYIARKGKPMILSTGLSTIEEIDKAIRTIEKTGNCQLILLHCVAQYPTPDEDVNINTIDMLRDVYQYPTGYSDHSNGVTACVLSVGKGACVIEKHYTLDRDMFGWDHKISADPSELKLLVEETKRAARMLGNYRKTVTENEERRDAFRRSIVASRNIDEGDVITIDSLDYKRPGTGIEPEHYDKIVGKTAKRDIAYDDLLSWDDF